MNRDGRSRSQEPTGEGPAAQPTENGSSLGPDLGLGAGRKPPQEDVVNRRRGDDTPRRYDQPLEEDGDPVMPPNDSTLRTKI